MSFTQLILASQSPRRKELLEQMGYLFEILPSGLAEMPSMGESPAAYCTRTAMEKAVAVGQSNPDALVIGADTVVALGDTILEKPKSPQEAEFMLSRLSGQTHQVWTGLCVHCCSQAIEIVKGISTTVQFKNLAQQEISAYVATGEPMDKAGSYAIQGGARHFVKEIDGSYHNVIGLPTFELGKILEDLQIPDSFRCA